VEVERELSAMETIAPKPLPPYLFKSQVVTRFQSHMRQALTSGERGVAQAYLDAVVDSIVLTEGEVFVQGKPEGVVAMMTQARARGLIYVRHGKTGERYASLGQRVLTALR
jgi:hypothetical protein